MSHDHFQTGTSQAPESTLESIAPWWLLSQRLEYPPNFHVNPANGYPTPPVPPFNPGESQYGRDRNFLSDAVYHDTDDSRTNSRIGINSKSLSPYHSHPSIASPNDLAPPFSPALPNEGPLTRNNRYQDLMNRIEEQQEALRDIRDNLVGSRFRLQSKRQELRATRMTVATEVGAAFSLVKRYLLQEGFSLPADIEAALSIADNSRDTLGLQENEYEEAEERYNQEEWRYTEKETAFIEGLSGNTPVPYVSPSPVDFDTGIVRLSHIPDGSLDVSNVPVDHMDSKPHPATVPATSHVNLVNDEELIQMPTIFEPITPPGPSLMLMSPNSTLFHNMEQLPRPLSHPHSDAELNSTRLLWLDTRKRIEAWLLDTLQCSKLEQYRLRSVSRNDMSDHDWWQLVVETWNSESPDNSIFHTGDTTASITTISEVPAAEHGQRRSSVSNTDNNTDNSNITAFSKTPLLLEDHFINRCADTEEVCNDPPTLESREVDKLLAFLDRPQSALSTTATIMTPILFSIDDDSDNEEEVHSSCTSSDDGEIVSRDHTSDGAKSIAKLRDDGLDAIFPFIDKGKDTIEQQHSITDPLLLFPTRPYSPESEHGNLNNILHRADSTENRFTDCSLALPPSPPDTRSCSPGSDRQSRCPFAPLVRFKNLTPWCFSLLRLTAFSERLPCTSHHRLEYFPFVFLSRPPFRLPGPVRVSEVHSDDPCD